jgi:hypothetical protein
LGEASISADAPARSTTGILIDDADRAAARAADSNIWPLGSWSRLDADTAGADLDADAGRGVVILILLGDAGGATQKNQAERDYELHEMDSSVCLVEQVCKLFSSMMPAQDRR